MKITYLYIVYSNPEIVLRSISFLESENSSFLIHIDPESKCDFSSVKESRNLHFSKHRYHCEWGGNQIIDAIVDSLSQIREEFASDYVVLISESDCPVKSAEYIESFLTQNKKDFIVAHPLPNDNPLGAPGGYWLEGGLRRLNGYPIRLGVRDVAMIEPKAFNFGNFRQFSKILIKKPHAIPEALKIFFCFSRRKHPSRLTPCGGDLWFILRTSSIDKILEYIKTNPEYSNYSKNTTNIDEIFFPTLSYSLIPKEEHCCKTLRYIHWGKDGANSPQEITLKDEKLIYDCINDPETLFIRKVKTTTVYDYLLQHCKNT